MLPLEIVYNFILPMVPQTYITDIYTYRSVSIQMKHIIDNPSKFPVFWAIYKKHNLPGIPGHAIDILTTSRSAYQHVHLQQDIFSVRVFTQRIRHALSCSIGPEIQKIPPKYGYHYRLLDAIDTLRVECTPVIVLFGHVYLFFSLNGLIQEHISTLQFNGDIIMGVYAIPGSLLLVNRFLLGYKGRDMAVHRTLCIPDCDGDCDMHIYE